MTGTLHVVIIPGGATDLKTGLPHALPPIYPHRHQTPAKGCNQYKYVHVFGEEENIVVLWGGDEVQWGYWATGSEALRGFTTTYLAQNIGRT